MRRSRPAQTEKRKTLFETFGLVIPVIIAVATYVTASISDHKKERHDDLRQVWQSQLAYNERQLDLLYGPLNSEVVEGDVTWNLLLADLARHRGIPVGQVHYAFPLAPDEVPVWKLYQTNDFMPRNERIANIIKQHAALIEGGEVPQDYDSFLTHYNSWRIARARWQQQGGPFPWHSDSNWPAGFESDVKATYAALERRHAKLLQEVQSTE